MKEYDRYASALDTLRRAPDQDLDNEFVLYGVVSLFSRQYDLGCALLRRLLACEGDTAARGRAPQSLFRTASRYFNFVDGDVWLQMADSNSDAEGYCDLETAQQVTSDVVEVYLPEFIRVQEGIRTNYSGLIARSEEE